MDGIWELVVAGGVGGFVANTVKEWWASRRARAEREAERREARISAYSDQLREAYANMIPATMHMQHLLGQALDAYERAVKAGAKATAEQVATAAQLVDEMNAGLPTLRQHTIRVQLLETESRFFELLVKLGEIEIDVANMTAARARLANNVSSLNKLKHALRGRFAPTAEAVAGRDKNAKQLTSGGSDASGSGSS